MNTQLISYNYDRDSIEAGIVHIGVGNFHRAHEEYYTNKLLEDADQRRWGICGIALLEQDERLYRTLQAQQNIYTLTVCGRDGKDETYRIGSLVELLWGKADPEAAIEKLADGKTKLITLTITEGGYNIDKQSGAFILDDADIQHDLARPAVPKTVFGFVAEGLRRRRASGAGPVTLLSCDNLQHNGDTAKKAFTSFVAAQDTALADWMNGNVTFPNSMVDRITPVTAPDDVVRLKERSGADDDAPVYCEDYIQWVIEDDFIAGRPAWERVGAEFTADVTKYEHMKLSLLNASHQMLSYPAFLSGYRKVDDAMRDARFAKFLTDFMNIDITPYVPVPDNTDLDVYKRTLIERFGNRSVSDQLSRLCFDGVSKIPVYLMGNLIKMIADNADLSRVTFFTAAYRHYLKYKIDDQNVPYEINDPWLTETDLQLIDSDEPLDFLRLSPFQSADLRASDAFTERYLSHVKKIKDDGVLTVLESLIA
ncbi:MAG: mannitol dehydrogenase family protein [Clostridiales Family XIII bacterium]|jgi:mannitol 2-dehydrogenase|nr:mannitol dehydrogenase family protein [Clostridiales Family XIII bacterium]